MKIVNVIKWILFVIGTFSEYLYRVFIAVFVWYGMINWFGVTPRLWFFILGIFYIFYPLINAININWERKKKFQKNNELEVNKND